MDTSKNRASVVSVDFSTNGEKNVHLEIFQKFRGYISLNISPTREEKLMEDVFVFVRAKLVKVLFFNCCHSSLVFFVLLIRNLGTMKTKVGGKLLLLCYLYYRFLHKWINYSRSKISYFWRKKSIFANDQCC